MRQSDAKLSAALREAGITGLAQEAERRDFNDFIGIYDLPAITLAELLRKIGTPAALAVRVRLIDGEFDASKEESDEWARSPEGQDAMRRLVHVRRRG